MPNFRMDLEFDKLFVTKVIGYRVCLILPSEKMVVRVDLEFFLFYFILLGCTDSKNSYTYIKSNTKFRKCG